MASLTDKSPRDTYKDILHISNSNNGIGTSLNTVVSGNGNSSVMQIADDNLKIKPINDDTNTTLQVSTQSGNPVLSVDTANSRILGGASQTNLNTQYAHFGISNIDSSSFLANYHYMIPFVGRGGADVGDASLGNGTDPAVTPTIISGVVKGAQGVINNFWHITDNITIDGVYWWHAADAATGDTTRAHLMRYYVNSGNGTSSGDMSIGQVVADGADITNLGYEQGYYQAMTIQNADINGSTGIGGTSFVLVFTFRSDSVNSDYSINATVKYHNR